MSHRSIDEGASYRIRGGRPISGSIRPGGNKNAALPMVAACLLSEGRVRLENLPDIRDLRVMKELIFELGVDVEEPKEGVCELRIAKLKTQTLASDLAGEIRASFLLAGPLLGRWGRAIIPRPGGDRIGRRPLDTHIFALQELGAQVEIFPDHYLMSAPGGLRGADIFLHEMSVMGTENALMAAVCAKGRSFIRNAASEPHVQELCRMIVGMGGRIDGIGTNVLRVEGGHPLGDVCVRTGPDPIETGSLIALAAVTGGKLRIEGAKPLEHHRMTQIAFRKLGIEWKVEGEDIVVPGSQKLEICNDLQGGIPSIDDGPWPAFPADLSSIAVVAATQACGTIMIHEKMFESRLFWVDRLISMGARIILCDPHRVIVSGPSKLHGQELASPDIRAGMALVIAALVAEGESVIHNIRQVERGYARLDQRLRSLGAEIERIGGGVVS